MNKKRSEKHLLHDAYLILSGIYCAGETTPLRRYARAAAILRELGHNVDTPDLEAALLDLVHDGRLKIVPVPATPSNRRNGDSHGTD